MVQPPSCFPKITFLSTPSARRATERHLPPTLLLWISIHALREEGDSKLADKIGIIIS